MLLILAARLRQAEVAGVGHARTLISQGEVLKVGQETKGCFSKRICNLEHNQHCLFG